MVWFWYWIPSELMAVFVSMIAAFFATFILFMYLFVLVPVLSPVLAWLVLLVPMLGALVWWIVRDILSGRNRMRSVYDSAVVIDYEMPNRDEGKLLASNSVTNIPYHVEDTPEPNQLSHGRVDSSKNSEEQSHSLQWSDEDEISWEIDQNDDKENANDEQDSSEVESDDILQIFSDESLSSSAPSDCSSSFSSV
jgi:hypothetical protein